MSHVRKSGRKAKPWRADVTDPKAPSGKVSKSFTRKAEASAHVVEAEGDKLNDAYVSPHDGQVILRARYDLWAKRAGRRDTTKDRETSSARSLVLPTFGDTPIAEISFDMVEAWVNELIDANYAASTIKKAHYVLAAILSHAVKAGKLRANPALGVGLPAVDVEVQIVLGETDIALMAETITEEQHRLWFLLSVFGGTRAEESLALKAGKVQRDEPMIEINETVVETSKKLVWGKPKTKHGKRAIELPDFLWEELLAHTKNMRGNDLVFTAPEGGPIRLHNFRSRVWQKAAVQAGLGRIVECQRIVTKSDTCPLCKPGTHDGAKNGHYVGPNIHDLRHTAVSLWIKMGSNPLQVQRRAGHSRVAFTFDRYGELFPNDRDPTMPKLDTWGRGLLGTADVTPLHAVS